MSTKKADADTKALPATFEERIERLEEIVGLLEKGESPLEDSLDLFEEGVRLARTCSEQLESARQRVEVLLKTAEDGTAVSEPLAGSDEDA